MREDKTKNTQDLFCFIEQNVLNNIAEHDYYRHQIIINMEFAFN